MCDKHHRLIDREGIDDHPVETLREMKRKHEERIEMVTSIADDMKSFVLLYGANIGEHASPLTWKSTTTAMLPYKYPIESPAIELSLGNSSFQDDHPMYWTIESEQLINQFKDKVKRKLELQDSKHLSVFALAPKPLLILLGTLISDLYPADVYQLHREPQTWMWQDGPKNYGFKVIEPTDIHQNVAFGEDTSIWTITIPSPNNDFLKRKNQLSEFRILIRELFNKINSIHGEEKIIHIFPAMSVSTAVELGRVWMPKADLSLYLYDENKKNGGFQYTFSIGHNDEVLKGLVRNYELPPSPQISLC